MIHDWIQHSDTSYNGENYTELNKYSSWADCSQLYGNNQAEQDKVRTGVGGLVKVGEDALLRDGNGVPITGVTINWWAGVEMMHVIFHKEHNSIAAALASAYIHPWMTRLSSRPLDLWSRHWLPRSTPPNGRRPSSTTQR